MSAQSLHLFARKAARLSQKFPFLFGAALMGSRLGAIAAVFFSVRMRHTRQRDGDARRLLRDRWFESRSLQRQVHCELDLPTGDRPAGLETLRNFGTERRFFKIGGAKLSGHCSGAETQDAARLPLSGKPKRAILVPSSPGTREWPTIGVERGRGDWVARARSA